MQWERMQKPLRDGFQAFRRSWPEESYVAVEEGEQMVFTAEHPEGRPYLPTRRDLTADDWAATGLSGE